MRRGQKWSHRFLPMQRCPPNAYSFSTNRPASARGIDALIKGAEDHLRDAGECLAPNFLGLTSVLPWSERCASRTQVLTPNLFLLEHRYRPAIASHLAIFLAPPPAVERRRRSRFHRWFRRKPITPDHRRRRGPLGVRIEHRARASHRHRVGRHGGAARIVHAEPCACTWSS